MKRLITLFLTLTLFCALLVPCASAAGQADLVYDLTVEGGEAATVKPGDIVTVAFRILRGDSKRDNQALLTLQNEIVYDQSFFEYVKGSAKVVKGGGNALFQTRIDGTHIIKASYLSPNGGSFKAEETFCTFRLRVVGTAGSGWVSCDWERAKAYNGDNKACTVKDGDSDTRADIWVTANGPCHTFTDVSETSWYHDAVDYVSLRGLMGGVGNDLFKPNDTTTRAMLVTVLYRMSGSPEVTGSNTFQDVKDNQWYTNAVIWANETGVVKGYGNGKFGTNDSVTREQIATIMYRYAAQQGVDVAKTSSLAHFADGAKVSSWAGDAVRWANAIGLMTGRSATQLAPQGTAVRAEVATILMRLHRDVMK